MENFISPLRFKKWNYVIRLFSNKKIKSTVRWEQWAPQKEAHFLFPRFIKVAQVMVFSESWWARELREYSYDPLAVTIDHEEKKTIISPVSTLHLGKENHFLISAR